MDYYILHNIPTNDKKYYYIYIYIMQNIYCVKFKVRLTEEEYCLFNNGVDVLRLNNIMVNNSMIHFDKCDKTLATIIGDVEESLNLPRIEVSAISPATPRVIHAFHINKLSVNEISKGVFNGCHNYEIMKTNSETQIYNKLIIKFPLSYSIKSLFSKHRKESDKVNVKLLVDDCSEGYDATLTIKNCMVCLEINIFNNISELSEAKNIKVVKDVKCSDNVISCFRISLLKHIYNKNYYSVEMCNKNYYYYFESFMFLSQLGSDIDGEALSVRSGYSVSLSSDGTIVAIGAIDAIDDNGDFSGHVRIYHYDGTSWNQLGNDIDGEAPGDRSGYSVSLSSDGTIVAIGATYNDDNGVNSGHVRIYQYDGTVWNQLGNDIDGEAPGDRSGYSVSLSSDGTIVAIGAYLNDGNGFSSGHVRIYQYDGSSWKQLGNDIDGEASGDSSGYSVSLSSNGKIIAIGGIYNDGNGTDSGHVRIYQYDGTVWNQLGNDIDGEAQIDLSGYSVSLSSDGTIVAIGAYLNDSNGVNSGHVRIYQYDGTVWNQLGNDIDGEASGDRSGVSVSLSNNGKIVAIGASENDGNGTDSGHVRIYQYDGTSWNQFGSDIDGEAQSDFSGYSVNLSSDGTIVAIGAIYNDGNGSNSGHVRIYMLNIV
jgi:hypothetical protein